MKNPIKNLIKTYRSFSTIELSPSSSFYPQSNTNFLESITSAILSGGGFREIIRSVTHHNLIQTQLDQLKAKRALEIIKESKEEVGADSYKIKDRGSSLFTSGLVYCNAVLMVGPEKIGLVHLSKGDEKSAKMIEEVAQKVEPQKIIHLSSTGIPTKLSAISQNAQDVHECIADFVEKFTKKNPQTILQKMDYLFSHFNASKFFYDDKDQKDFPFLLSPKQMKKMEEEIAKESPADFSRF